MTSSRSIQPAICELERLVHLFGETFHEELFPGFKPDDQPQLVITVLPKGRHNAIAWFAPNRWDNGEAEKISEINICAEHLHGDRYAIANALLHEIVHFANWLDGIKDCSGGQYHNRRFRDRCARIGLKCENLGKQYGWARTSLSGVLMALVDDLGVDESAFGLFRRPDARKRAG
jgi:hypothetical protein